MQGRIQGFRVGSESESIFEQCFVPRSPSPPPRVEPAVAYPPPSSYTARGHHHAVPRGAGVALIDQPSRRSGPEVGQQERVTRWDRGQDLADFGSRQRLQRPRSQSRSQSRHQQDPRHHPGSH